jgi:hypothetical protein
MPNNGEKCMQINIRMENPKLTGPEIKVLLLEGNELFDLLNQVVRGQKPKQDIAVYLKYHPKLKPILEKWTEGIN